MGETSPITIQQHAMREMFQSTRKIDHEFVNLSLILLTKYATRYFRTIIYFYMWVFLIIVFICYFLINKLITNY